MSLTFEDRRHAKIAKVANVEKSKDKTFISRMVKAITNTKLEGKYFTPEHKRKKRIFTRKLKTSPTVPREFARIYNVLAPREPETVTVPEPFPHARWNKVQFKPTLLNP